MARVSLIMGIYNCGDTLSEALDSILSQTYCDWKVIMCDDCSTDDTYKIALRYVKNYPDKFFLFRNPENMGLNITLNSCLTYVDSEFVARMDGDDISLPDRLEKEVCLLDDHPEFSIVSCNMIYFDEDGEWGKGNSKSCPVNKDFLYGTPFCHAPCLVRKIAYDAVGGYTVGDKFLRVEDYHLWIKMYSKGFKGYNINEFLYKMRDNRDAIGRRKFKYRINESRIIRIAVKELKLSKFGYLYSIKPLVTGILPSPIYKFLHKMRLK